MGKLLKGAAAVLGLLTAAEAGGTAYFYRRTMKRYNAKTCLLYTSDAADEL